MLVICEDCGKKYNIDESRIKRKRARFTCNECGHIIIVDKADMNRPLFSSVNLNKGPTPASSVDLVREMQSSPAESSETDTPGLAGNDTVPEQQSEVATQTATGKERRGKKKSDGMSLITAFIVLLLFTLVSISGVTGYLFVDLFADPKIQMHEGFLLHTLAYFGAAWIVVLIAFALFGLLLQHKIKVLTNSANQLASGVYDVQFANKGLRELRYLACSLEKVRQRMKTLQ